MPCALAMACWMQLSGVADMVTTVIMLILQLLAVGCTWLLVDASHGQRLVQCWHVVMWLSQCVLLSVGMRAAWEGGTGWSLEQLPFMAVSVCWLHRWMFGVGWSWMEFGTGLNFVAFCVLYKACGEIRVFVVARK